MTIDHKAIGVTKEYKVNFEGVINFIGSQSREAKSRAIQRWADDFMENVEVELSPNYVLKDQRNLSQKLLF